MEYVQMTLDDWVQMKQKLKQELLGVKQSFVRIGYALRQIDDQKLYEQDGYKSIAEFAQAEYGLGPSITSRFMSINREYSIDGYSEQLRPEYAELGRSQLEEMLKLLGTDRQMIQPETSREDIRELKRFNKTEPAAGTKTWQNHFGGADDEESTVQDTANEPGREENATKAPKPEDDGGAVGETGADDVQEIEKGGMEDHGAADEAGTGQEEDDTDGEESGQADCEEPAERTDEQTGAQSQREEIAPAQKSTETLEKEEVEDDETGENESSDTENQTAESEPETAEREQTEETEVIEAVYGTGKEYMDRLSEQGMAEYMADEYKSHRLLVTDLENIWNLCKWLSEKVDRFGQPVEEE